MRIALVSIVLSAVCLMACWQPAEHFTPLDPLGEQKEITSFGLLSMANPLLGSDINATVSGTAITATVPFGTNVSALVATFATSGASVTANGAVQTSGVTANDFSAPVTYLVTAENGSSAAYTVSITVALSPAKDITAFAFLMANNSALSADVTATITGTQIAITVPFGTNVTALKATFQTTGTSVAIASVIQNSGTTANNFTAPLMYVVSAADSSTRTFIATVTIASNTAKELTSFAFLAANNNPAIAADVTATITGTAIAATVPFGTNVTALKATFQTTGTSVAVSSVAQTSGVTANNFTSSVAYTVTAADTSTKVFTVTVTIAANLCANVACVPLDQCHMAGTCNPLTGTCTDPIATDGASCADGLSCTINDQCVGGNCSGTPMPTEAVDQAQPFCDSGLCSGADVPPYWQEFVPGANGNMTKLTFFKNGLTGQQTVTLNVYNGTGPVTANRILSQAVTIPNVQNAVDIALQTPLHLTAGLRYTWEIVDPGNTIRTFMQQNKYPNGISSVELKFGGTWDFQFRTWMIPDCP